MFQPYGFMALDKGGRGRTNGIMRAGVAALAVLEPVISSGPSGLVKCEIVLALGGPSSRNARLLSALTWSLTAGLYAGITNETFFYNHCWIICVLDQLFSALH